MAVTSTEALLWTDGRYFLQAEKELGPEWKLMRAGLPSTPDLPTHLATSLPAGSRVGIDPQLHSATSARALRTALADKKQTLVSLPANLVDAVWGAARPPPPTAPLRIHPAQWAGASVSAKLAKVRADVAKAGAQVLVVAQLDEVMWLLNVRGGDVECNPVALSYLLLFTEPADAPSAVLFCDAAKVGADVKAHLEEAGVTLKPYGGAIEALRAAAAAGRKVLADPAKVSLAFFDAVEAGGGVPTISGGSSGGGGGKGGKRSRSEPKTALDFPAVAASHAPSPLLVEQPSPIAMAKAVKNAAELAGFKEAHLRDAAALAAFFAWLEAAVEAGEKVTESSLSDQLLGLRAAQQGFIEPSFPTIAGAGPNGAIIHYRPDPATCASVTAGTLLLLDSGGQYDCGTTDVTRTMFLGPGQPSEEQKDAFTRVLLGHIALDSATFPENTPGFVLDVFARRALWEVGLDYRHGTGHGVGAALNVHEGPHGIAPRYGNLTGLVAGMIVSNEPGFYLDGRWGIRIENLVALKEAETTYRFGGTSFLCFERLTQVPIQRKMLAHSLLGEKERAWLDAYHAQVWELVSPRCTGAALAWLRENTLPL